MRWMKYYGALVEWCCQGKTVLGQRHVSVPLRPPFLHWKVRDRIQAFVVTGPELIAWTTARLIVVSLPSSTVITKKKNMMGRKYRKIGRNVKEVKGEITNAARTCTYVTRIIDFINEHCMFWEAIMLKLQEHFSVTSSMATRYTTWLSSSLTDAFCVNANLTRGFTVFPSPSSISFYNGQGLCFLWDITWIFKSDLHEFPSLWAVQWFRPLVAGVLSRKLGFANSSVHMKFVVGKVALRQVFI